MISAHYPSDMGKRDRKNTRDARNRWSNTIRNREYGGEPMKHTVLVINRKFPWLKPVD